MAAVLRMIGVDAELGRRAKPAPTAVAAAAALDCEQGAIADSLVFDTAGKPLLALASGAHRVDTKKLAQRLGTAKIRRPPLTLSSSTPIVCGQRRPGRHPRPVLSRSRIATRNLPRRPKIFLIS